MDYIKDYLYVIPEHRKQPYPIENFEFYIQRFIHPYYTNNPVKVYMDVSGLIKGERFLLYQKVDLKDLSSTDYYILYVTFQELNSLYTSEDGLDNLNWESSNNKNTLNAELGKRLQIVSNTEDVKNYIDNHRLNKQ